MRKTARDRISQTEAAVKRPVIAVPHRNPNNYFDKKEAEGKLQKQYWPPQSPDLNPIKHLWDILDQNLEKSSTSSQHVPWKQLQAAWLNISEETSKKLVISMPERIKAVIKAKGSHTKY